MDIFVILSLFFSGCLKYLVFFLIYSKYSSNIGKICGVLIQKFQNELKLYNKQHKIEKQF